MMDPLQLIVSYKLKDNVCKNYIVKLKRKHPYQTRTCTHTNVHSLMHAQDKVYLKRKKRNRMSRANITQEILNFTVEVDDFQVGIL